MTPEQAIAQLDRQIARSGQTVQLRKASSAGSASDRPVRAFVRGYQPEELTGGIQQGDRTMLISPSGMAASGFDGPLKRGDRVVVDGKIQAVLVALPVLMNDVVVRHEVWLRGA